MQIREGAPSPLSLNLNTSGGGMNRQTLNSNFAGKLRHAARETTLAAQRAVKYVAPFVPGAAIVSAGLSNAAQNLASESAIPGAQLGVGSELGSSSGGGDFLTTMQDMQQNMMSSNMQMLSVQRKFQQMSEHYLTASNILKTKHDTDKNSINNIR